MDVVLSIGFGFVKNIVVGKVDGCLVDVFDLIIMDVSF